MELAIALGAACLLVRVGVALYGMGVIRAKNAAGSVLRSMCDLCAAVLAFGAVGAAVFLNDWNLIGFGAVGTAQLFFLATVILIGTAIPAGAIAERSRFWPLSAASVLLAALVIPLGANWAWVGWLARRGFIDTAGGSWLHLSGAMCALAGAVAVGARTGKYNRDGSASMIPGHNVPLAGIGALAMLAGWAPYVAGCLIYRNPSLSAGPAAMQTLLCGAAAGLIAMLLGKYRYGKPDVILTLMGFLGGLAAIAAGAGQLSARSAVAVGAVAGIIVPLSAIWLDLLCHVDDPSGVIAIHGVGGFWGTIAVGLFMPGDVAHRFGQLGVQVMGAAVLGLLSLLLSALLFAILRLGVRLRATEADEFEGLDLAEHDIGAYPDFQQTMIKSYHLREA
jgi:Amt family ammonium transporter